VISSLNTWQQPALSCGAEFSNAGNFRQGNWIPHVYCCYRLLCLHL